MEPEPRDEGVGFPELDAISRTGETATIYRGSGSAQQARRARAVLAGVFLRSGISGRGEMSIFAIVPGRLEKGISYLPPGESGPMQSIFRGVRISRAKFPTERTCGVWGVGWNRGYGVCHPPFLITRLKAESVGIGS